MIDVRTVASTGSTNADVAALARSGAAEGVWLRAEAQTGGRGRYGRVWQSPPGNLYASTFVRPIAGDPPAPTLALVAGVALHEVAAAYAGLAMLMLKWPNDLMGGGAKLAGILLEGVNGAVVIGFGVNLAHHPTDLDRPATSFAALGGTCPDPATFLTYLAETFGRWLALWRGEGLATVRRAWIARAHPAGTPLVAGGREGLFDGLDEDGALRLRLADGRTHVMHAGDVFLL